MKRPIYFARKDAEYHILRINIHRFTKVLGVLRVGGLGERRDCYLELSSRFLLNLWPLVFHGSRVSSTREVASKHVQVTLLLFTDSGVEPQP
jgi:hypothetical protein